MKPNEIIEAAEAQAESLRINLFELKTKKGISADYKEELRNAVKQDIKRLDALITLIDTDC